MKSNTKSALFLMEQLIAIVIFAVCAAICVAILVSAFTTANEANDLNHALVAARNGAEVLKATDSLEETATVLGGYVYSADKTIIYFDNGWHTTYGTNATFILTMTSANHEIGLHELAIHNATGDELVAFSVHTGRRLMP